ncbi:MAG: condensation domain-containing protein, partial [Cyanobacteria bacterium P01_F01_bin.4]
PHLPDYLIPAKFIWLDAFPLTPNGKIDRRALPAPNWESDRSAMPQTDLEKSLVEIWTAVLRLEAVGIHDNFFDLGGDSILALQIVSRATQAGLTISPKQLFQCQTIAELAAVVNLDVAPGSHSLIPQEPATGTVPLTPIQHWFFNQALAAPHHFNQSICLELPPDINRTALGQAIAVVYQHHDALRLRFTQTEQGWQQQFAEAVAPTIQWFNFENLSPAAQDEMITHRSQLLQASLNLQTGPLINIGGFNFGESRPSQLLIVIHHLVVDGVSWRVLLADLQQAYQQVLLGVSICLAPKTHSYQQWANQLIQLAASEAIECDRNYWQAVVRPELTDFPQDSSLRENGHAENTAENTIESTERVITTLSSNQTQTLLQTVPSAYNTQITDALLMALTQTLTQWTEQSTILIDLENYGRFSETLNLSRTVGWFTCLYPMCLSLDLNISLEEKFKAIKAQLRGIPHDGLSYGLLRYSRNQHDLAITPAISFNYLGQLDLGQSDLAPTNGFRRIPTPAANQATVNQRLHQIDINSWVEADQLHMEWTFNRNCQQKTTIHALAQQFIDHLDALIAYCLSNQEVDYTPGDFSLVQLDQTALDAVLTQVSFAGEQEVSR